MIIISTPNGDIELTVYEEAAYLASLPGEPATTVETVSARQFKLQLLAAGLIDEVEAWIAQQDRATRISYEYSGSFVKSSLMMQAGFAAMGFTSEQVDEFFTAASAL